jgi:hypothetical protein
MKTSKKKTAPKQAPQRDYSNELSEKEIENLAEIICRSGDDPENKTAALLILMDEVEKHPREDIAGIAKRWTYTRHVENYAPAIMNAQVQMLRDEFENGGVQ